jgi:hypothetical protein
MVDMREYSGSDFLKVEHVRDGPRQERIVDVSIHERYNRPVLEFESGDKLTLNVTNTRTLCKAYGDDDRDWIKKLIELSLGHLEYDGKENEAVIVRPLDPPTRDPNALPAPRLPKPSRDDMDDAIPF